MPGKIAVLLSDLTSDLVYLAALPPHAFIPGRDVSYARQNWMPTCTNLPHAVADRKDFHSDAHVSHKSSDLVSPPTHPLHLHPPFSPLPPTHPRHVTILSADET